MIALLLLLFVFVGFGAGSGSSSTSTTAAVAQGVRVPDVTGTTFPVATRRVRRAGLVPVALGCRAPTIASGYTVRKERPAAGTTVRRGARVRLYFERASGHTPCNAYAGPSP